MGNPLPTHLKTFRDALVWLLERPDYASPRVRVLAELYQGANPLFRSAIAGTGDAKVGGVCQGMALEWIKGNSVRGGGEEFRRTAGHNWDTFAAAQVAVSHFRRRLRPKYEDWERRSAAARAQYQKLKSEAAYAKETGWLASAKQLFVPPMSPDKIGDAAGLLKVKLDSLDREHEALQAHEMNMYAGIVFPSGDATQKPHFLGGNLNFERLVSKIQGDEGSQPAYYMVMMAEERGHCIAIQGAGHPRLLDANGCELKFESRTLLYAFLNDYWQIYKRAGYASPTLDLFRFEVRAKGGSQSS
jgi:hypothetical protein